MGELNEEIITVEQVNADVVYQQDKAQIDIQIATAKSYPRNIKRSLDNSIAIVTMDAQTAATCNYSLPRGGKSISGPSVHLATILAQNWGNLRAESKVVEISGTQITSQAVCFDLENNLAIKVEVKRSIMTKNGRMNDDMITVTGNAANSIAFRNAVLKVIPKAVVDKVYNAAKDTITGDISDENKLIQKRKLVFDKLRDEYGITEKEVLTTIGKAAITNVTKEDLVTIIGIGQALKDGDTTVEMAFRSASGKPNPETEAEDKRQRRLREAIEAATTLDELKLVAPGIRIDDADINILFDDKKRELTAAAKTK